MTSNTRARLALAGAAITFGTVVAAAAPARQTSIPTKTVTKKLSYARAGATAGTVKRVMSPRGDIIVDDSTENIREAEPLGLRTLQPAQPWNNSQLTVSDLLRQLSDMAG